MNIKYTCRECGKTNIIDNGFKWFFTPHLGAKKYLKCIWCGHTHAMKRVDGRKWLDLPIERKEKKDD